MTSSRDAGPSRSPTAAREAPPDTRPPVVGLAEIEPALAALLAEWLAEAGIRTVSANRPQEHSAAWAEPIDLVVVDIPFPRQGTPAHLRGLALAWPHTPILALSATFFANVAARGAVARELGVASVMAKPVSREAWLAEVRRLLGAGA